MFNLGWVEIGVICAVALLIFGPKKIPELGGTFGKTLRNFKEGLTKPEETDISEDDRA
ncbi:twin-arginine translocase TatA/TatE family subunit [Cyanobacteria bacterium FACHB-DQ100]|uniref:twin-arginine translocase TatA/TatE family subunit n=1 Tax=unclassified Leptolyngbya TaxID=2650499 RepID=UPI0016807921|nr:twin-arginine translocase TatA/TatE family subunit [Leptolyngbya sp. FACHB-17]MBD1823696.1 twin-arginine translocase TatA/TatE family subunit [Cyanobacteria bacterium FACHB-DQ100]MBD2079127.1 twin-arginine translocase TatA/TatE family subunit [Leptolyngbya sp. FACHB-17]